MPMHVVITLDIIYLLHWDLVYTMLSLRIRMANYCSMMNSFSIIN